MPKKQITIPIFIPHMGCPHNCVFCNQWSATSTSREPDRVTVRNTIENHLKNAPPSVTRIEIAFFGGSFTALPRRKQEEYLSIAHEYKRGGYIHGIRLSTRPDYIDRDGLELLINYGVTTIELGIQSFNDEVLSASERSHTSDDCRRGALLVHEYGFNLIIQLLPGLPKDSPARSRASADEAAGLSPEGVRLYPAVVLEDTALAARYRNGTYEPLLLEEAVALCADMLEIFNKHSIPVIRMGLHPFSPEEELRILAGPYHPSFGYLVKSRHKRNILERNLDALVGKRKVHKGFLYLPRKEVEEYLGIRKENIQYIKNKYGFRSLEIIQEDIPLPYGVITD